MTNLDNGRLKNHFANKGPYSQSYGFSWSQVWMWELDHKKGWVPKSWCFWTVGLEKTLESPLFFKEMKAVNPKGSQPWIVIGRTYAEAKDPIPQPPEAKSWLTGKDPDAGKDWRQKETGWQKIRWLDSITNSINMNLTPGDSEGQGSLACCHPCGSKVLQLCNWTMKKIMYIERKWTKEIENFHHCERDRKPWVAPQTLLWKSLACRIVSVLRAEGESLEREIKLETEQLIKEKEASEILERSLFRDCLFSITKVMWV